MLVKWQWRICLCSRHYGVQYSETTCTAILREWFLIILNSFEYPKVFWNVLKQLCHIGLCSNIGKVISNPGSPEILLSVKMWDLQKRSKDCNCVLKHCFFQVLETLHFCGKNSALISVYISQGCQRFETSVFFSEKINISTTGGSRVGFFQPDTNHP